MRCNMCGIKVSDYAETCTNCGAKLIKDKEEFLVSDTDNTTKIKENNTISQGSSSKNKVTELQRQQSIEQLKFLQNYKDKPSILLNIIAIFSPFIIIVIAIAQKGIYPKRSKSLIKWAIIGIILSYMFRYLILPLLVELILSSTENVIPNFDIPNRNYFSEIKVLINSVI